MSELNHLFRVCTLRKRTVPLACLPWMNRSCCRCHKKKSDKLNYMSEIFFSSNEFTCAHLPHSQSHTWIVYKASKIFNPPAQREIGSFLRNFSRVFYMKFRTDKQSNRKNFDFFRNWYFVQKMIFRQKWLISEQTFENWICTANT